MYIIKNALVSITRNKGRNILIGIIVLIIAFAASITLAIKNSASSLINSYTEKYEVKASIGINRESMRNEMTFDKDITESDRNEKKDEMIDVFSSISNITVSEINTYGNSEYVSSYYYTMSIGMTSEEIEKVSMEKSDEESNGRGNMPGGFMGGKEKFTNISSSDFTFMGYSSLDAMEEFISGKYSITEGEVFSDLESNSCVINSELASSNDISVGEKIEFADPNDEDNTIKLTVTGIYEEVSETDTMMSMFASSANTIITNINVINTLVSENEDINVTTTPTFILTSSDVVEDFESELTELGLSEYLSVTTNLDEIEESTSTISNVSTFATTFLIITLIIGGVVLFVINMINIRERKYEIGVLRTIGMKKSLLSLQFIFELALVSFVALLIGCCIGALTSVPISNSLLESEISSSMEQKTKINENFGGRMDFEPNMKMDGVANVQEITSIDAVVDFKVLIELLGIGLVLTLISSLASMISIQKFSPLTILKERS